MPILTMSVIRLAGGAGRLPERTASAKAAHRIEHGDEPPASRPGRRDTTALAVQVAQRRVQHGAAFGDVDLLARRTSRRGGLRDLRLPASFSSRSIVCASTAHFDQSSSRSPSVSREFCEALRDRRRKPRACLRRFGRTMIAQRVERLRLKGRVCPLPRLRAFEMPNIPYQSFRRSERLRGHSGGRGNFNAIQRMHRAGHAGSCTTGPCITGINPSDQKNSLAQRFGPAVQIRLVQKEE